MVPIFGGTPKQATDAMIQYRNVIGVIGFIALLWTGTKIFGSLEWGFCQVWDSKRRSFARGKLIGLLMVTAIGVVFVVSLYVQFLFAAVWGWMVGKEGAAFTAGTTIVKPLVALGVNFLLFWFIYQVVPTVKQSLKRSAVGALISAVFFLAIQYVLAFYFGHISNMPSVYGGVTTVIVLILWLHITGMIIFLGAEIIHAMSDEEPTEAVQVGSDGRTGISRRGPRGPGRLTRGLFIARGDQAALGNTAQRIRIACEIESRHKERGRKWRWVWRNGGATCSAAYLRSCSG
jgi:YihY family inner membrane protein